MPADSLALTRALLVGQTSAGQRVAAGLPQTPVTPHITFELIGGSRNALHKPRAEPRVQINAWGATKNEAYQLAREIEAVLIPHEVSGFHGNVTVSGSPVYVWDVRQEVGPTYIFDETGFHRYYMYMVIVHY